MNKYEFQYCQKIIILSKDKTKVLLCKRKGEADYDEVFSFAGGKMENTDVSIINGLKREKDEELGKDFILKLFQTFSFNMLFRKKDGNVMILPHYLAFHEEGNINLNINEYSEYEWVEILDLEKFEPKIGNITETLNEVLRLEKISTDKDFVFI